MYLDKYDKYIFEQIDTKMEKGKWYNIDKERTDYDNFISAIKKRIDLYGDCEFNSDYTKFKKIGTWEEIEDKWENCDSKIYKELNKKITIVKPTEQAEDVWAKIKRK